MNIIQQSVDEWLRKEAHVLTGHPFWMDDCSCVPVAGENARDEEPIGFLVTHGADVVFVDAHTPDGEQIMNAWMKGHLLELEEKTPVLPAECWYG